MLSVALRGLAGRKLRSVLTALAVVLGVAMISGTYVLTDTIDRAFDNLFRDSYANTDVVVKGTEAFETPRSQPPSFPESVLADVRALPGVEAATGGVSDLSARLTDRKGDNIDTGGAPTLAFGLDPSEEQFNPLTLTAGRWASGDTEVVLDTGTAEDEGFRVGDSIGIAASGPVRKFTIVGLAKYGSVNSLGGAAAVYFDVPTAQRLFDKVGKLDGVQVAAAPGVAVDELLSEIRNILPPGTEARTGAAQAEENAGDVEEFTKFIRYFLLAFGGIALFVGAFVIFNTLSITVAQRTREFATLRTIGASRRQVLGSVVFEALVIGLLASLIGLLVGLGLARGLNAVFVSLGIDLPSSGTVVERRTIVVSLVVGTLVTVFAGLFPAIRATRVPPIAAVREGAVLPKSWLARRRTRAAAAVAVLGLALLLLGMFREGISTVRVLVLLGAGVIVLFVGIALVSERLVQPLASVVGLPSERIGGAVGRLARENATRNPSRTAATAAALMIGLALITFVAVLAQGLTESVDTAIDAQVSADYVVVSERGFTPFDPAIDEDLAAVDGVSVAPVRGDFGRVRGKQFQVTGIDPATTGRVYRFSWEEGSNDVVTSLRDDQAIVEAGFADDEGLSVGDRITVESAAGRTADVAIVGIYRAPSFWQMLGQVSLPVSAFDRVFESPQNLYTFIDAGGGNPSAAEDLRAVADRYPGVELGTQEEFKVNQSRGIDRLLRLLYVLLALSVIVSLFGMVNTLVLSVFERTRELGLLRAVGLTRRQARRMVRHESVITALIGASLGMPLGVALAALVTTKLSSEGLAFAIPWTTLVVFVVAAIGAGIVAAVLPARRAARLNVLSALQYE